MKLLLAIVSTMLFTLCGSPLAAAADTKADAKKATPSAESKTADKLDINSADEKALMTLDGIGEARAAAIVKGRPYRGRDDLVNRKILPEPVYEKIKDRIIARQKSEKK